ncbi:PspC domain-containing protein [Agromyces protaetiae]|uniref:PspC domain-containing protein n=1 Tax=Agromyces protaetiae TaxID=2509455 RepID=A0A4P6F9D9_9MICO|nr:PspC domain-containing protein [Agromyces protaetiae]QAY72205.1 PspC domain-containing protein [Agromyces protaetiae]
MDTNTAESRPAPDGRQGDAATESPQGSAGFAPDGGRDTGTHEQADATGDGFFPWLRRLGVPRRDGWLGGVCAGVAARLGIDPIIVRGVVFVAAVLGAPFVLLYAIAWLLLPDTAGRIHLERLLHGRVDTAVVGIAVMGVVGFLTLVQGGWFGWRWWPDMSTFTDPIFGLNFGPVLRVFWTLAVIGGIVWLVTWLITRSVRSNGTAAVPAPGHHGTSAQGAKASVPDVSAAAVSSDTALRQAQGAESDAPEAPEPPAAPLAFAATAPTPPADGADAAAIAEWRAQHDAWRRSHAEWKAGQDEAARAARAQAAAENKARAREYAAAADAARAARRKSRPRTSAAYVFTVIGLALVAGAATGLLASASSGSRSWSLPAAFAVATLVLAAGMIVAALRRRRGGFLAFVTAIATVVTVVGSLAPTQATLVPWQGYGISSVESGSYFQPTGYINIFADRHTIAADGTPEIELTQWWGGGLSLNIDDGARVELVVDRPGDGYASIVRYNADMSDAVGEQVRIDNPLRLSYGGGWNSGPPDLRIHLVQRTPGWVDIQIRPGSAE